MKRKITPLILALALTLTACNNQPAEPETIEETHPTTTLAPTTTEAVTTHAATTQEIITVTATETTTTEAATTTEATTTEATTAAPLSPYYEPSNIPYMENPDRSLMAQYEEFNYEQYPSDDKTAEEAVIAAYKASDYYKEALEETKELLKYENGELKETTETWKTYFGGLKDFVDETAAPEIDIKPKILTSIKAKLDGKTEENLFVLAAAMPDSCIIASSEKACIIFGVYVNSEGQVFILDNSLYQGRLYFSTSKYINSGKIHAVFNGNHSEGTASTAVYSFENGQPKVEMYSWGNLVGKYEDGKLWEWEKSYSYSADVFYNEAEGQYYQIKPTNE